MPDPDWRFVDSCREEGSNTRDPYDPWALYELAQNPERFSVELDGADYDIKYVRHSLGSNGYHMTTAAHARTARTNCQKPTRCSA